MNIKFTKTNRDKKLLGVLILSILLVLVYSIQSPSYAENKNIIFKVLTSDNHKEKIRQSEYYKELKSLVDRGEILNLHKKIHLEVFQVHPIEMEKFSATTILLEDETEDIGSKDKVHTYLLDLHATALNISSKHIPTFISNEARKEHVRLMIAGFVRIVQWKILAEEDARRCKYKKEALSFIEGNISKYNIQENIIELIGKDKLVEYAMEISEKYKSRPPNRQICEMSKEFKNRLEKTGVSMYATEQEDGTVLVHLEDKLVTEKSKSIGYLNAKQIEPEYVTNSQWLEIRDKIRNNFYKAGFSELVLGKEN